MLELRCCWVGLLQSVTRSKTVRCILWDCVENVSKLSTPVKHGDCPGRNRTRRSLVLNRTRRSLVHCSHLFLSFFLPSSSSKCCTKKFETFSWDLFCLGRQKLLWFWRESAQSWKYPGSKFLQKAQPNSSSWVTSVEVINQLQFCMSWGCQLQFCVWTLHILVQLRDTSANWTQRNQHQADVVLEERTLHSTAWHGTWLVYFACRN